MPTSIWVPPTHEQLAFAGYVSLDVDAHRAKFLRQFGTSDLERYGFAALQSSGARVQFRTGARFTIFLNYVRGCNEHCAIGLDRATCYHENACYCQCEVKLLVDGVPQAGACKVASGHEYVAGPHECTPMLPGSARTYDVVMPWGAQIEFRGIRIDVDGSESALLPLPPTRRVRYIGYGDSITHGWCGKGDSYVEQLATLRSALVLEPINLGIQGLGAWDAAPSDHGAAIALLEPAFVTIMLGINDWCSGGTAAQISEQVLSVVDRLRALRPRAVVALITPIAATMCKDPEPLRHALRVAYRTRAADAQLLLVEGGALMAADATVEGLHPSSPGKAQLALNLHAELGLSRVRSTMQHCTPTGSLSVRIEGLTPSGKWTLYYGAWSTVAHAVSVDGCGSRALGLEPRGYMSGTAAADGTAVAEAAEARCAGIDSAWVVLDELTCATSRVGSRARPDDAVGTVAALLVPPPHPQPPLHPPPSPLPRSPPLRPPSVMDGGIWETVAAARRPLHTPPTPSPVLQPRPQPPPQSPQPPTARPASSPVYVSPQLNAPSPLRVYAQPHLQLKPRHAPPAVHLSDRTLLLGSSMVALFGIASAVVACMIMSRSSRDEDVPANGRRTELSARRTSKVRATVPRSQKRATVPEAQIERAALLALETSKPPARPARASKVVSNKVTTIHATRPMRLTMDDD